MSFFNISVTKEFNAASADLHQANLNGTSEVEGHLLNDGNLIFVWVNDPYWKMVLTTNKGIAIKAGYLRTSSSESWMDPSTWTDNSFYSIKNFRGRGRWTSQHRGLDIGVVANTELPGVGRDLVVTKFIPYL